MRLFYFPRSIDVNSLIEKYNFEPCYKSKVTDIGL